MASKAHTLHGAAGEEGIFGLAMADIFAKREVEDLVTVAMYQLRSGGGLDLLNPEPRASLNTTQIGGRVGMRGVAEIVCRSKEEARELVAEGIAISHIMSARHKLKNPCTLLEVSVTAGRHPDTRESMLRFVLLADCDGADEELQNLHQCIRLLVAPDANVPYNDSVLCRLLEPALRGQALLCYLALVVSSPLLRLLALTNSYVPIPRLPTLCNATSSTAHMFIPHLCPHMCVYPSHFHHRLRWMAVPTRPRMQSGPSKRPRGSAPCRSV
jgi:hypothetical protein